MRHLRGSLWFALFLSAFLHTSVIVADLVQEWMWVPDHEESVIRNTKKKLKSQSLDDPMELALPKVKPAEKLTIYMPTAARGGITQQSEKPPAMPKKKKPPRKTDVVKVPAVIASAPAGVPGTGDVMASSPAVVPVEIASTPDMAPLPILIASAVVASQPAETKKPGFSGLSRFPSDLKVVYRWGLYSADMHWQVANGRYKLTIEGSGFGLAYRFFESHGRVDREGVHPEQFVEYRERDHKNPKYQLDFDYVKKTVEVGEPGKRKLEPMGEGDHDIFSAAFHLALMGGDEDESKMNVYTGRRKYEDVHFKVAGESTLSLSNQDFETVLLSGKWKDRRFDFFLAPQWHNIPVRMNVVVPEYGGFDFWAQEVVLNGKTVLEWKPPESPQSD